MDTLKNTVLMVCAVGIFGAVTYAAVYITASPRQTTQPLGGLIASPVLEFGGNRIYGGGMALTQAASTTCSIQSPASTSTLLSAGIKFDTSTSTGSMILEMGKANDPNSTTTLIGTKYAMSDGAPLFLNASTSPAAGAATVFGPNQYFNIKWGGTQAINSNTVPVGRCQALFVAYPTL